MNVLLNLKKRCIISYKNRPRVTLDGYDIISMISTTYLRSPDKEDLTFILINDEGNIFTEILSSSNTDWYGDITFYD